MLTILKADILIAIIPFFANPLKEKHSFFCIICLIYEQIPQNIEFLRQNLKIFFMISYQFFNKRKSNLNILLMVIFSKENQLIKALHFLLNTQASFTLKHIFFQAIYNNSNHTLISLNLSKNPTHFLILKVFKNAIQNTKRLIPKFILINFLQAFQNILIHYKPSLINLQHFLKYTKPTLQKLIIQIILLDKSPNDLNA